MKEKAKGLKIVLIVILTVVFFIGLFGMASAAEFKIQPKGKKKIKIGAMDFLSSIEVAAFVNSLYIKEAKKRNWDIQIFDLKGNNGDSIPVMENMLSAGVDGILVNWTSPKFYAKQVKEAFAKGVPVITNHAGDVVPGQLAEFTACLFSEGAEPANYLGNRLKPNDKVIMFYGPQVGPQVLRFEGAMTVLRYYKLIPIIQAGFIKGDPTVEAYEGIKNALVADVKKEIKGVWAGWEGFGVGAARAAHEVGRDDVIVVTIDDSPRTIAEMRKLPTLHATAALLGNMPLIIEQMFNKLEAVFKGKSENTEQIRFCPYYLVTKENMPPVGYYYRMNGKYSGPPDYKLK